MNISFTKEFLRKVNTPNYPMRGFWIQLGGKSSGDLLVQWSKQNTDLITCNSFLTDDGFRFSFDVTGSNNQQNKQEVIYLFALDLNMYSDITEVYSSADDPNLFGQLAGVIDLDLKDPSDFNKLITNIFDIKLSIKCSMNLIGTDNNPQVEHYNSNFIGKSNYYDPDLMDNQLIDKGSGIDRLREILSFNRQSELLGCMTIRKSGIVQL